MSSLISSTCEFFQFSADLSENELPNNYQLRYQGIDPTVRRIRSVLLTDCANAYSSVCSMSAGSSEKSIRLLMAHLRNHIVTNILSYCDALMNLGGVGTKLKASSTRWKQFALGGIFHISFLGRKRVREAIQAANI